MLQKNPTHAFAIMSHGIKDDKVNSKLGKLWKKELPDTTQKMQEFGNINAIIGTIGSIIHAAGSKTSNVKAKQRAALTALSMLFPSVRNYAGAFFQAQNLSDLFGVNK